MSTACPSRCGGVSDLGFAEGAERIYLKPFVHTVHVEKMAAWKFAKLLIVHIFRQAYATDLQKKTAE